MSIPLIKVLTNIQLQKKSVTRRARLQLARYSINTTPLRIAHGTF
jgi:hypothetical protein